MRAAWTPCSWLRARRGLRWPRSREPRSAPSHEVAPHACACSPCPGRVQARLPLVLLSVSSQTPAVRAGLQSVGTGERVAKEAVDSWSALRDDWPACPRHGWVLLIRLDFQNGLSEGFHNEGEDAFQGEDGCLGRGGYR